MSLSKRLINSNDTGGGGSPTGPFSKAYVTGKNNGYVVEINISDPNNMTFADSINVSATVRGPVPIAISEDNNNIYVGSQSYDLVGSFDVNPFVLLDTFADATDMNTPTAIERDGNVLYVTASISDSITSLDISDPNNIVKLNTYRSASFIDFANGLDIDRNNKIAYVRATGATDYITAINISNPSGMFRISSFAVNTPSGIRLDVNNNIAYVISSGGNSIISIDISNPSAMVQLDEFVGAGDAPRGIALDLENNVAYICGVSYVSSVDISNPSNMSLLNTVTSSGNIVVPTAMKIDYANNLLYGVDSGLDGIVSIDISNPSNMVYLSKYTSSQLDLAGGLVLAP